MYAYRKLERNIVKHLEERILTVIAKSGKAMNPPFFELYALMLKGFLMNIKLTNILQLQIHNNLFFEI